ncbi:MAG: phosphonate C-P lyase system protein PhnH, partial [Verrucomicrobiota bacterium]
AKEGVLTYPELSATFILQVTGLSSSPEAGMVGIDITGPGVKESATVYVGGLNPGWVDSLMEKNSEFPLGVDAILVADSANGTPEVMCLPRTSSLKIIN